MRVPNFLVSISTETAVLYSSCFISILNAVVTIKSDTAALPSVVRRRLTNLTRATSSDDLKIPNNLTETVGLLRTSFPNEFGEVQAYQASCVLLPI